MIFSDPDTRGQYQWGMKFDQEVKFILGRHFGPSLVHTAPDHLDTEQATDVVIGGGRIPISVRIRRHRYLRPYGGEFTIRMVSKRGQKSELEKISEGYSDYLFYGFANQTESSLEAWRIIDLTVLREHLFDVGRSLRTNTTGEHFAVFVIREFPPELISAQSDYFSEAQGILPIGAIN